MSSHAGGPVITDWTCWWTGHNWGAMLVDRPCWCMDRSQLSRHAGGEVTSEQTSQWTSYNWTDMVYGMVDRANWSDRLVDRSPVGRYTGGLEITINRFHISYRSPYYNTSKCNNYIKFQNCSSIGKHYSIYYQIHIQWSLHFKATHSARQMQS